MRSKLYLPRIVRRGKGCSSNWVPGCSRIFSLHLMSALAGFMGLLLQTVLLSNNFVWQTAIEMLRYTSMEYRVIKPLNWSQ